MLHYDSVDISEEIDLDKSNNSKECHYWFFNHGFTFQDSIRNGCLVLSMLSINISDIAIIAIRNVDYCFIVHNIGRSKAIDLLKNSVLENEG